MRAKEICKCGEKAIRHIGRFSLCEQHYQDYLKHRCQARVAYVPRVLGYSQCTRLAIKDERFCRQHLKYRLSEVKE